MTTRREQLKGELLGRYATMEPSAFYEYTGVPGVRGDLMADADGDSTEAGVSYQRMDADGAKVRVFISTDVSATDAARLLKKVRRWIQRDGFCMRETMATHEAELDAELCPRCGALMPGQQGSHHTLCRNEDGSLTALSDDAVREAIRLLKTVRTNAELPF